MGNGGEGCVRGGERRVSGVWGEWGNTGEDLVPEDLS